MTESQTTQPQQPQFEIQRLYVKEKSIKVPHAPVIFNEEWKPDTQLEMNVKFEKITTDVHEVQLRMQITAKNQQRTAFTLDLQQAGTFKLAGFTEEQLKMLLHGHCPTILFPYARKSIGDAMMEAGFPPLLLAPINFEALYQQQQASEERASKKADKVEEMEATLN